MILNSYDYFDELETQLIDDLLNSMTTKNLLILSLISNLVLILGINILLISKNKVEKIKKELKEINNSLTKDYLKEKRRNFYIHRTKFLYS